MLLHLGGNYGNTYFKLNTNLVFVRFKKILTIDNNNKQFDSKLSYLYIH